MNPSSNEEETHGNDEKANKIREIVKREFQSELKEKEQQAIQIEDQIVETKKILNKLRYAIVSNYYKSGSSDLQAQVQKDIQSNSIIPSGIKEFDQQPIHPSLKKLIGKKPVNYDDILQSKRTTRKAAQKAISDISEKFKKTKAKRCETITRPIETSVSVPKTSDVVQLTSSRGRNQLKHTIVVGNTSQYISEQSTSDITHKWLCYLKTKSFVSIERLVKKVQFHLDRSYAPNDVIEVTSPPFQLTRRGYGEFPIKLLIFFKDEVNLKPVQIYHELILDKKFSGHQTLGHETVSELWTRNFLTQDENEKRKCDLSGENKRKNHLEDHDYCKLEVDGDKKDVKVVKVEGKVASLLLANQEIVDWISDHKRLLNSTTCNEEDEPSFDVNVEDSTDIGDEPESLRIPGNFELESKFVEISCQQIDINYSIFDRASKLILIKLLRKFVEDLITKAVDVGSLKHVNKSDIEKQLNSRPEFDFLSNR